MDFIAQFQDLDWDNYIDRAELKEIEEVHNSFVDKSIVYPNEYAIFNAFKLTPFRTIKIVILGQDPYHNPGQANGLAFSVNKGCKIPPSLRNIYKLLMSDQKLLKKDWPELSEFETPLHGDLTNWAKNGVLLLNTSLTVFKNEPNSNSCYWKRFTDNIIKTISNNLENIVFILWGAAAQSRSAYIDRDKHFIIESSHPSPYSAHKGFLESQSFYRSSKYIFEKHGRLIDWQV